MLQSLTSREREGSLLGHLEEEEELGGRRRLSVRRLDAEVGRRGSE